MRLSDFSIILSPLGHNKPYEASYEATYNNSNESVLVIIQQGKIKIYPSQAFSYACYISKIEPDYTNEEWDIVIKGAVLQIKKEISLKSVNNC